MDADCAPSAGRPASPLAVLPLLVIIVESSCVVDICNAAIDGLDFGRHDSARRRPALAVAVAAPTT